MEQTVEAFVNNHVLSSFPCTFRITNGNTFQILYHLIKGGRRMIANVRQVSFCILYWSFSKVFFFFMGANICLYLAQLLGVIFILPPTLDCIQVLWMMLVIIPLISLSLSANPVEPNIMELISRKHKYLNSLFRSEKHYHNKGIFVFLVVQFLQIFNTSHHELFYIHFVLYFSTHN